MRRTIRRFLSMLKTMYMMTVLPSPGSRKNPAQASETPNSAQRIWNLCGLSFKISPCFVQDDIATFLSVEHYVDPVVIPMDRLMHVLLQRRQLASRPFEFHEECLPMGWVEHHIGPSGAYEESSDLVLLVEQPSGLGVSQDGILDLTLGASSHLEAPPVYRVHQTRPQEDQGCAPHRFPALP